MENFDDLIRQLRDPNTPEEQFQAAEALFNMHQRGPFGPIGPDVEEAAARVIAENPGRVAPLVAIRVGRILINHQDQDTRLQGARLLLPHLNGLDANPEHMNALEQLLMVVTNRYDPGTPEEQFQAAEALFNMHQRGPFGPIGPDVEEAAARVIAENPGRVAPLVAIRVGRILINHQDPGTRLQGARLLLPHLDGLDDEEIRQRVQTLLGQQ